MDRPIENRLTLQQLSRSTQLSLRGTPAALNDEPCQSQAQCFKDCSWDQVLQAMDKAKNEHDLRTKGSGWRSLPKNRAIVSTLHSLADTIPDQNGLGILRGGLKTLFEILEKRIENRDKILQTFEDVPLMFFKACEAFKNQPDDALLRRDVENLCATLNDEISKLILMLNPERRGFSVKRMLKHHPEQQAESIDASLAKINRAAQKVTIRAESLINGIVVENLREAQRISSRIDEAQAQITGLHPSLDQIRAHQIEDAKRQQIGYDQRDDHFKMLNQKFDFMEAWFRDGLFQLQQNLHQQLNHISTPYYNFRYASILEQQPARINHVPEQHPALVIANHEHDEHLVYIESINRDLERVTRRHNDFDRHAMARASWLLVVERFQAWMQSTNHQPDLVLVDGYLGDHTVGKVSPLALVTVALQTLIDQHPQLLLLYFFCGLHLWDDDIPAGPKGMLQSLIAQLIFRLSVLNPSIATMLPQLYESVGRCNSMDLGQLCPLFATLVSMFPPGTTIYIILNDVSEFETEQNGWEEDLCGMFDYFRTLIGHLAVTADVRLKLLMTVAHRSITLHRRVNPHEHLSLEAGNESSFNFLPPR